MNYSPSQVTNRMRYGLRLLFDPEPSKEERQRALKFFQHRCAYCGESDAKLHLDHLVASSERYGHNCIANRVPACSGCNANEKREMPWRIFLNEKWENDPQKTAELSKQIEGWLEICAGASAPSEELLDILDQEFARVKAEYDLAVERVRWAKRAAASNGIAGQTG